MWRRGFISLTCSSCLTWFTWLKSFSQGGYLEGKLRLPREGEDGLRIVISTRPDRWVVLYLLQQVTMQKFKLELSGSWQTVIAIICHLLLNFDDHLEKHFFLNQSYSQSLKKCLPSTLDKPARLRFSVFVKVDQNNYKYWDGNAVNLAGDDDE